MSQIKRLDSHLINQIAAGEVIESPSAVIKELVENSIDAGATHIEVALRNGGKSYISIKDNGSGMNDEDLHLAVERHATSKLKDLFFITTLGFRGEALASIASISRLSIISKTPMSDPWKIELHGGQQVYSGPTFFSADHGTWIEVSDLFYATPARLKFLKTDALEQAKGIAIIKKMALAHPHVTFKLWCDEKLKLHFHAQETLEKRVIEVFHEDFQNNAMPISYKRDRITIEGMMAPPTLNSAQSTDQHVFVNQRYIKDKLVNVAIKLAYGDTIPSNRYASVCLFLTVSPEDVDVNVHPTKTEIRFFDPSYIKDHIIRAIRENLHHEKVSTHVFDNLVVFPKPAPVMDHPQYHPQHFAVNQSVSIVEPIYQPSFVPPIVIQEPLIKEAKLPEIAPSLFGEAKLQVFDMFIIAQRGDELLMIDQHAAHERVLYERYKQTFQIKEKHTLLIPEIISVKEGVYEFIKEHQDLLKQTYIECSLFGQSEISVYAVPAVFAGKDIRKVIIDFTTNVMIHDQDFSEQGFINNILATLACHNAIKAGQSLNIFEMQHLLQEMSVTPHIAQCNHGRPTHIVMEKKQLEKMFLRI